MDTTPLKPVDILEIQIKAEIATGAIKSLDEALHSNNVHALELSAQSLFDGARMNVAKLNNLPERVIFFLSADRSADIRCELINTHFDKYTDDMKEKFFKEAENYYSVLKADSDAYTIRGSITKILTRLVAEKNDEEVCRLLKRCHHEEGTSADGVDESKQELREMPETVRRIFDPQADMSMLDLMHPNVKIRLAAVKVVTKYKVGPIRRRFPYLCRSKQDLFTFIAKDSDIKVRRLLMDNISEVNTLSYMVENDPSPLLRQATAIKLNKLNKRAIYAQKYHASK